MELCYTCGQRLNYHLCDRLNEIVESGMEFSLQDEVSLLKLESNTWDLLQLLMSYVFSEVIILYKC